MLPCVEQASPKASFWKTLTSEPWSSRLIAQVAIIKDTSNNAGRAECAVIRGASPSMAGIVVHPERNASRRVEAAV
jgi:hypothetical protein